MGEAKNIYFTCLKFLLKKKNNQSANMQLFVRGYLGVHTVDVTGFESVESLKNRVCQLEGIDEVENQILNLNGSPLIEEKKKKKTGRARRRIQYNRRFVNVVATFGRKKGPNSNS